MLKKFALLGALLLPLSGMTAALSPAKADADVRIYLGVPYYGYRPAEDYRFYPGRGWYRPVLPGRFISCARGRNIVRNSGYRNVRVIECNGPRYTYRATRNGRVFILSVNARTGRLLRM